MAEAPTRLGGERFASSKEAVYLRLSRATVERIVEGCDSVEVTASYPDGTSRKVHAPLGEILDKATGMVQIPDLPLRDCSLDVLFLGRDGTSSIRITATFDIELSDGGTTPARVERGDSNAQLVLRPEQDAWIGPEDNNAGLGAELRLWEGGAIGLMDFGDLVQRLKGRTIDRAELVLHGWKGDVSVGGGKADLSLDIGTTPCDWIEGTGNWYWFDGQGQNGFASAFALWKSFVPPARSTNPSEKTGIDWSSGRQLRTSFRRDSTFVPELGYGPSGMFPTREMSTRVAIDVTAILKSLSVEGANRCLALRRATSNTSPPVSIAFYSKDLDSTVAPRLTIRFTR